MIVQFLSQLAPIVYWSWPPVFLVHCWLNYDIYRALGKEEFSDVAGRFLGSRDNLLAVFTFRWSKAYMEDDNPEITRLMRISNKLSIVLIVLTVLVVGLWMFLYGK